MIKINKYVIAVSVLGALASLYYILPRENKLKAIKDALVQAVQSAGSTPAKYHVDFNGKKNRIEVHVVSPDAASDASRIDGFEETSTDITFTEQRGAVTVYATYVFSP